MGTVRTSATLCSRGLALEKAEKNKTRWDTDLSPSFSRSLDADPNSASPSLGASPSSQPSPNRKRRRMARLTRSRVADSRARTSPSKMTPSSSALVSRVR